eukprot:IDg12503t1
MRAACLAKRDADRACLARVGCGARCACDGGCDALQVRLFERTVSRTNSCMMHRAHRQTGSLASQPEPMSSRALYNVRTRAHVENRFCIEHDFAGEDECRYSGAGGDPRKACKWCIRSAACPFGMGEELKVIVAIDEQTVYAEVSTRMAYGKAMYNLSGNGDTVAQVRSRLNPPGDKVGEDTLDASGEVAIIIVKEVTQRKRADGFEW